MRATPESQDVDGLRVNIVLRPLVSSLLRDTNNLVHEGRAGLGYAAVAGRGHSACTGMRGEPACHLGEREVRGYGWTPREWFVSVLGLGTGR